MPGPIHRFLSEDHDRLEARLEALLDQVREREDIANDNAYVEFRAGILRHIAMEEKVLLPFAREKRGGSPLPIAARMRSDHGAIAALMAPPPTPTIIRTLRTVLEAHNPLEVGPGGLYETIESLAGPDVEALLERIRSVPEVRLAPHSDSAAAIESMREAVRRAGYRMETEDVRQTPE